MDWNLPGSKGIVFAALIANLPQLVLSFTYLLYNALYTCMLLADEWSRYGHSRKALRVSSPIWEQRSTYRLQLPYLYSIPLLAVSTWMHWLVSQSIFLVRIAVYDSSGQELNPLSKYSVGYSCIAIICTIFFGSLMVLVALANGFRKDRGGMPLVGSCSAAISAACHPHSEDSAAALLPLQWGVHHEKDGIGYCGFSSREVRKPVVEELYSAR